MMREERIVAAVKARLLAIPGVAAVDVNPPDEHADAVGGNGLTGRLPAGIGGRVERLDPAIGQKLAERDPSGSLESDIAHACYLFSQRYLSIAAAAFLPAPIARMTVAAPVTASPPA